MLELERLQEEDGINLFFREETCSEASFAGLIKKVENALIIAFPGTRTNQSMGTLVSDGKADVKGLGQDFGFVQSLGSKIATSKVIAYPGFASEVVMFYSKMFQLIGRYTEEVNEIYFTGHS